MTTDRIRALVRAADYEVIPLRSLSDRLTLVPTATRLAITCSPKFGLERTLEHTKAATTAGYRVVPHVAARQVRDEAELRSVVGRLRAMGVEDLYVIGGDAPEPIGDFTGSADLLEALVGVDHGFERIGVACYPEGHPSIPDDVLHADLLRKQPMAQYMVSQLCFDPAAISTWLRDARARGVTLPLRLSVAAPLHVRKLVEVSMRIGVGSSMRYLRKQHGLLRTVLRGGAYRPEDLLDRLGDALTDRHLGVEGLHLSTFNQLPDTVAWQARVGRSA